MGKVARRSRTRRGVPDLGVHACSRRATWAEVTPTRPAQQLLVVVHRLGSGDLEQAAPEVDTSEARNRAHLDGGSMLSTSWKSLTDARRAASKVAVAAAWELGSPPPFVGLASWLTLLAMLTSSRRTPRSSLANCCRWATVSRAAAPASTAAAHSSKYRWMLVPWLAARSASASRSSWVRRTRTVAGQRPCADRSRLAVSSTAGRSWPLVIAGTPSQRAELLDSPSVQRSVAQRSDPGTREPRRVRSARRTRRRRRKSGWDLPRLELAPAAPVVGHGFGTHGGRRPKGAAM